MTDAIIDACCFINLYATGDLRGFLSASEYGWHIPTVALAESLFVRASTDADEDTPEPIVAQPLIEDGLLEPVDVEADSEAEWYVRLAAGLDDGEAMALAISKVRGWMTATDDRKARRIAASLDIPVVTTPELMQQWAERAALPSPVLQKLLRNIMVRARFSPAEDAPGFVWWASHVGEAG
ncbi:MAG TPA: hypothetical protein VM243_19605 [Phycisphaerae bacterium]|nr:hypothetical protein [Phycisphaerae bacterium]